LQTSQASVTWTRFSFFAISLALLSPDTPWGGTGHACPGSGGGTRTRDPTIMSRVL
jgi:hypothetical protein